MESSPPPVAFRKFLIPLPRASPSWGILLAPKMSSTTTRTMRISPKPSRMGVSITRLDPSELPFDPRAPPGPRPPRRQRRGAREHAGRLPPVDGTGRRRVRARRLALRDRRGRGDPRRRRRPDRAVTALRDGRAAPPAAGARRGALEGGGLRGRADSHPSRGARGLPVRGGQRGAEERAHPGPGARRGGGAHAPAAAGRGEGDRLLLQRLPARRLPLARPRRRHRVPGRARGGGLGPAPRRRYGRSAPPPSTWRASWPPRTGSPPGSAPA